MSAARRHAAAAVAALCVACCVSTGLLPRARAERCASTAYAPRGRTAEQLRDEARALIAEGRLAEARVTYERLSAREPDSYDVRVALARVDAWAGCFEAANTLYEALLRENPNDLDVLPGYIDLLLWSKRPREAERELARGFSLAPNSAELWLRQARIYHWQGEREQAMVAAERAERLSPSDLDVREFRDGFFRSQVRATLQLSRYPKAYRDLWVATLFGQRFLGRLELGAEAQLIAHANGDARDRLANGLYSASAFYHTRHRFSFGMGLGVGAPARSIPLLKLKPSAFFQLTTALYLALNYEFWHYRPRREDPYGPSLTDDDYNLRQWVHVLRPALGYALSERWTFEVRPVATLLVLKQEHPIASDEQRAKVGGAGVRLHYRHDVRWSVGAGYTYGPQVERAQGYEILDLPSHIANATADWLIRRHFGASPSFTFERRTHRLSDARTFYVPVYTFELASYCRW